MLRILALALSAVAAASGCGTSLPDAERPRPEAGKTAFAVHNHVRWPYELERVALRMDGRPVFSRAGALPESTWLEPMALAPGWHLLVFRVVASFSSDMVGSQCTVELRTVRVLAVDEQPATVSLDLHLRGVTRSFSERLDVAVRASGARVVPLAAIRRALEAEQGCDQREAIEALVCRAERRTAQAQQNRNTHVHACLAPKLKTMRALSDVRHRWLERMKEDPQAEAPAGSPAAMVLLTERRLQTMWQELELCAPYGEIPLQESSRTVQGAGCDGPVPE